MLLNKAVMRESLRLGPTASSRTAAPIEDTTLGGGKYFVKAGSSLTIQTYVMHRDPKVWGEDVSAQISVLAFGWSITFSLGGRIPSRKNDGREV